MNEEELKKQALQFRELVGDELFWFTMSRNVMAIEKDRRRFGELALEILDHFEWEQCCLCCSEMPIHLNDKDVERLYRLDGDTLFDKMDAKEMDNFLKTPCPYLKGDICTIYEDRLSACKMFFPPCRYSSCAHTAIMPDGQEDIREIQGVIAKVR